MFTVRDIGASIQSCQSSCSGSGSNRRTNAIPEQIEQAVAVAPVPINLPTALAMIEDNILLSASLDGESRRLTRNLTARKIMWLPSIHLGLQLPKTRRQLPRRARLIVDVNLNSFNYGLGAGAVEPVRQRNLALLLDPSC